MWHEYPGQAPCINALTHDIVERLKGRLDQSETCTLAVSGGRSPIPLFKQLAQTGLPWTRIRVRLVDERWVPPEHADSNERLARQHLLTGPAGAAEFRGLYLPGASIDQAVDAANDDAQPITVAVLGMGDDGHMASLFPGAGQLPAGLAPDAPCYLHVTPPAAPHERLSLSLAALRTCDHRLLYIDGAQKKNLLLKAQNGPDPQLPVSFLAADPGVSLDVYWHP